MRSGIGFRLTDRVHLLVSVDRVEELGFSMKALGKMRRIMQDAEMDRVNPVGEEAGLAIAPALDNVRGNMR